MTGPDAVPATAPRARDVFGSPVHLLAFGFGAGLAPRAPGTFGTLVGIPLWWTLSHCAPFVYAGVTVLLFVVGCSVCGASSRRLGVHDYGGIVFDEVIGYVIAAAPLLLLPMPWMAWKGAIAAFALFRLFDVWKPWPIRHLDQYVEGGFGIMLDDAVAAVFAAAALMIGLRWAPVVFS